MMGPVGKCLETALHKLLAEEVDNSPIRSCNSNNDDEDEESSSNFTNNSVKLDESISRSILESYRKAVIETKFDHHERRLNTISSATITLSHNVTNNFMKTENNTSIIDVAPAAMLKGEIDHYNRIGGQWRIVVKNAVLKRRSLTMLDNGLVGRSCRRRTVLDWDYDNDNNNNNNVNSAKAVDNQKQTVSLTGLNTKKTNDKSDVSLGRIQILAYDDDT